MNLRQGTLLKHGEYRIERELGHGGFGVTYLAVQVGLNRRVAIKEFFMSEYCERDADTSHVSLGTSGSRETVERFRNKFIKEAQNIAGLKHPHIISIYDVFEDNGTAYYVMEYLDHGSLDDLVTRQGSLPEADALSYIRQIADALRYIHARNMNHLDVKPVNILIDENNAAVLIDFRLSKRYDDEGDEGDQTSTTPVGFRHGYAPLEQYKKGGVGTFSPSTDIYSLGATLYKLITGATPPGAYEILIDGLPAHPGIMSAPVYKAIKQAMKPNKNHRPQTIEEFLALLEVPAEEVIDMVVTPDEDERTVPLSKQKPKSEEKAAPVNEVPHSATANVDRPVGFWALVPVVVLLTEEIFYRFFYLNIWTRLDELGMQYAWEYVGFAVALISCAYFVSGTFVFAKMGKSGNKIGSICLYAWTCLALLCVFLGMISSILNANYIIDIKETIGLITRVVSPVAYISLIVFLVTKLIKTSAYKIPLIVGLAGAVFGFVNTLAYADVTYYAHAILMSVSFLLMFFASRKLAIKGD